MTPTPEQIEAARKWLWVLRADYECVVGEPSKRIAEQDSYALAAYAAHCVAEAKEKLRLATEWRPIEEAPKDETR